jgi:hypothetical protein
MPNTDQATASESGISESMIHQDEGQHSFRGPLRYEVETSSSQLEAGRKFTVFLKVTNPYDVPVKVLNVETQLPIEFEGSDATTPSIWKMLKERIKSETVGALAQDVSSSDHDTQSLTARTLAPDPWEDAGNKDRALAPATLQPGNALLKVFTLRTRQTIFFTPSLYTLHLQIQYEMDGTINRDAAKYQLNMRAPLKAVIYGAVAGSIVGSLLRSLYEQQTPSLFEPQLYMALVTSVLLGSVLVIAFARKREAQPFITIEDFYGGFFVGFVAGYVGKSLVDDILPAGKPPEA